jgi:hypothetical protein
MQRLLTYVVLAVLLSSCSDPTYAEITLEPRELTVVQGETATLMVNYTVVTPFSLATLGRPEPLTVVLEKPHQGIQAEPLVILIYKSRAGSEQMTITAAKDAALGTFTINLAQDSAYDAHRVPLELKVVAPN